ncbi:MAG: hypothetical protein IOC92_01800 [Rhodobacter sp.]|nr:hypothetical protein [Rhodobacter sp.]MCA3456404.1 hypothetical protein [Rhodobacter sp.]MCA3460983.1 hypothetical protein [Rhodobacter sp.]MCA3463257.1 hypothetical protein [Rhodobacter sp.]MCA3468528.1 hypothetical protein [Rhodobacter sp.]
MPDVKQNTVPEPDVPTGDPPSTAGPAAVIASIAWISVAGLFFFFKPVEGGILGLLMTGLIALLPIALLWAAVSMSRSVRSLRDEAARLQAAVDAMRNAFVAQNKAGAGSLKPSVEKKLDEIAAAQRQTETALAMFTSRRDATQAGPSAESKAALVPPQTVAGDEQPTLALGTPAEDLRPPLSVADFIRALNFPETAEDKAGFRALRLALEDRTTSKLIRAAQDVLTLLSQDGIYMDDLRPERARPEVWRRFARGERGRAISALGGVRDRSSLALTAGRMREDPVFRDAAHHFLRQFDRTIQEFEKNASDQDMADLAETRTARAFMLFGRVTGTFD